MSIEYEKRVLALAGIFQSVHLVSSAARSGMVSQDSLEKTLKCIFVQNPASFSDIYSGTNDVRLGLSLLADVLRKFSPQTHAEMVRYSLSIMALERGLAQQPEMLTMLGERLSSIEQIRSLAGPDEPIDDTVSLLAELYETTLSQLRPRIKIAGNRNHLQNLANVQRIRALLMSAIRSAVLWQQVGGRRWQLLLCRGQMREALSHLI